MGLQFQFRPPARDARLLLAAGAAAAVEAGAEQLLQASQPLVPVDQGDLKASGRVEKVTPHHARVIYDATSPEGYPYGIRQHEDMSLHHPNGGQAKFLEQPMHTEGHRIWATAAAALRKFF